MYDKLTQLVLWFRKRTHGLRILFSLAVISIAAWMFARMELQKVPELSTGKVSPASISAPAELPTEAMKTWVLSVINTAVEQKPIPAPIVTTIIKSVPVSSQALLSPPVPPPAIVYNNYNNSYPSTVVNNYGGGTVASVSNTTNISAGASVGGSLSVAGLLTLNGGLDLTAGLLSSSGLDFHLPSVSDTLVGLNDVGTLANKTISAATNTITDLGVQNFANHTLSQWTDDIGMVTHDASGFITGDLLGNASTATTALTATVANTATLADSVLNGLYTTGTYANPGWLTSVDGSKLVGTITANALDAGSYAIDIAGNAASATVASTATSALTAANATLADTATTANSVLNGLYSNSAYINPTWLTSIDGSKLTGVITANALSAGTYAINVTGNAASATVADTATLADSVLNGLYSTGTYTDPSWITSLDGSKLIGAITANALTAGQYAVDITGNAATATLADTATAALTASTASLADTATLANSVVNGIYSTGSYANPSWLTSINGSKLVGTVTANALANGSYAVDISGTAANAVLADTATNALAVVNGLYSTGSYSNPSWLTGLSFSKIASLPTTLAGYGIADAQPLLPVGTALQYLAGDKTLHTLDTSAIAENGKLFYTQGRFDTALAAKTTDDITEGLAHQYLTIPRVQDIGDVRYPVLSGSYSNPSWITSLNGSKLVGTITANALASGTYDVGIVGNAGTVTNGLYSNQTYTNPSWLSSLDGTKLTGTVTANAITAGSYAIDVTGNAASATLASTATTANSVLNGVYTTGSYVNPSWITGLSFAKISNIPNTLLGYGITDAVPSSTTINGHSLASSITLAKGDVGLSNVPNLDTTNPANITQSSSYRFVSDTNAAVWNAKQAAISTGNSLQYLRGDLSLASFPTDLSSFSNDLGFVTALTAPVTSINSLTGAVSLNTDSIAEGSRKYFTDARVQGIGDVRYPLLSGSYSNPSWIASLPGSKLTGTVTATAIAAGLYGIDITGNAASATLASTATLAAAVTNGVYTNGTYSNPTWITGLSFSKLSSLPTTLSGYSIADAYTKVQSDGNYPLLTGSYANPSWLTSVDGAKLTGTITANAITAGTYAISVSGNALTATTAALATSATNALTVTNGVYTTGSYSNPSWISSVDGSKLTGTITANALAATDYVVNNISTSNTVVASGTLANTAISGGCLLNLNALGLAAFQTSATITTSQIFYNSSKNRHSRITSVSSCTDGANNPWRIVTLSDSITGSAAGDSYTIYAPTGSIGNTGSGFFNNFYAITLKGLVSTLSGGFDVAEQYQTNDDSIQSGDVVSLDPDNAGYVKKSASPYEPAVIGIVATNPGLTLGDETVGTWKKVALTGHVPVKVSTENGPISIGDYLTTSSQPGIAMKATSVGAVIGKAMEPYDADGIGLIQTFVNVSTFTAPHVSMTALMQSVDDNAVTVDSKVLFNGGIVTDTIAANGQALTLLNDTIFIGRPYFNADTAGFAIIRKGSSAVTVTYDTPYLETPIVTATITGNVDDQSDVQGLLAQDMRYAVSHNSPTGFTIVTNVPVLNDMRFSWTAFMVKDAKTASSAEQQSAPPEVQNDQSPPVETQSAEVVPEEIAPPLQTETPEVQSPQVDNEEPPSL